MKQFLKVSMFGDGEVLPLHEWSDRPSDPLHLHAFRLAFGQDVP